MSRAGHPPHSERPPLEPWALELEESEPGGSDPATRDELSAVIAMLRGLPDPEPPPQLSERILARVAEDAARPRVLRGAFGAPLTGRAAALAMAAGIASLLVLSAGPVRIGSWTDWMPGAAVEVRRTPVLIRVPAGAGRIAPRVAGALPAPEHFGGHPQLVSLPQQPRMVVIGDPTAAIAAWDRQLDHQLNQLQLDPDAFAQRLEQVSRRDDFIARLARRAGERGDAPEIAMRVRRSDHPLAPQIVHRLLRAELVRRASGR